MEGAGENLRRSKLRVSLMKERLQRSRLMEREEPTTRCDYWAFMGSSEDGG